MIRFSNFASPVRIQAATVFLGAVLLTASAASALDLEFNVVSGNYNVASNWADTTNVLPVPAAAAPTVADSAYVRNGGTATINSNVEASRLWVGRTLNITNPDYDGNTVVDAADYVLWRKGGPFVPGPPNPDVVTPGSVTPEDYDYWRLRFGGTPVSQNIGQAGTLNWTDGEIIGPASSGPNLGGVDMRVGRHEVVNGVITEVPGTVIQNGPNTKILLPYGDTSGNIAGHGSVLTIGDAGTGAYSSNPISSYTLMDGTIGVGVSSSSITGSSGTNGNNGILVRNGTFTMTGGQIIDATQEIFAAAPTAQRFLTVASQAGGGADMEAVATANLSGGNVNVLGGIRVATANHSRGFLNISGTANIVTGGDTHIGYQPTNSGSMNAVGEMNMSGGTLQVGRTDPNPNAGGAPYNLSGRFQVGDRGKGILNMSGGTINVTRNVVVGNEGAYNQDGVNPATLGSIINQTGGTITTGGIEMRRNTASFPDPVLPADQYSASIIVDGPSATFTTTGLGSSPNTVIGNNGKALFEVRQGNAVLGGGGSQIQVGNSAATDATINVKGGKLTIGGPVNRGNLASAIPKIGLTGGTLELNPATGSQTWQADFINAGSRVITRPSNLQQVNIGSATHPGNFSMTSGSWDLEIGANTLLTGSDRFVVASTGGTGSLTGGTLNLSYILGYTPTVGDTLRIVQAPGDPGMSIAGVTLNAGAVTIAGQSGWSLMTDGAALPTQILLKYGGPGAGSASAIPEPSSVALLVFAMVGMLSAIGRRHRTRRPC